MHGRVQASWRAPPPVKTSCRTSIGSAPEVADNETIGLMSTTSNGSRTQQQLMCGGARTLSAQVLLVSALPSLEPKRIDNWLERFGGLRGLLRAGPEALQAAPGMNSAAAARIKALQEIARRYHTETLPVGATISGPADTRRFLSARLRDLPHEVFCCLYLDNRHRVLAFEELFRGTIDGTSVYPREVVCQALQHNAAAIIVAQPRRRGHHAPPEPGARARRHPAARPPHRGRRHGHLAGRPGPALAPGHA